MAKKKVVLCDPNVLFRYFRGNDVINQELDEIGFDNLAISAISEAEMLVGMKRGERRKTTQTLNKFDIIDSDRDISRRFINLTYDYNTKPTGLPDLLIAATALEYGYELFTFNRKDFDFIKEIKFYQPTLQHLPFL